MKITVIKGDGIGPSIVDSALRIMDAADCGLTYDVQEAGLAALEHHGNLVPEATLKSIESNKIALKGPLTTPVGKGFSSVNVSLRKTFELYANLRPVVSFRGTQARYENIDIVTIRENTEGLYSGLGQTLDDEAGYAEARSVITRKGSERILKYAFDFASTQGRKKVTVVHKANILKSTSGLFLDTARDVAAKYPNIEMEEMIVDNACMQLVMNPHRFDVIVTTNMFGDILSDLCAGLVGGLGMAPGGNIGDDCAIFEAVHGSAPDIAGKNIANPSSVILASIQMLQHLGLDQQATRIRTALAAIIAERKYTTPDLGGQSSTTEFSDAIIGRL